MTAVLHSSTSGALALVAVLASVGCSAQLPPSAPHDLLGKPGEVQSAAALDGTLVAFPERGRVTVVDFWGTSCKPCIAAMPGLEDLYQDKKGAGLTVVGVAVDDNPGLVDETLKKLGVHYPNLLDDTSSSVRGAFLVTDIPRSFVFDRKGKLRLVIGGEDKERDMVSVVRQAVDFLLEESP
ncbi:MAG: TlpA family protein disulfide reductase [Polyangiaceae bacterium]|nr:TlpA family protein disulfide reductase [Polyangiaceae bacterium]